MPCKGRRQLRVGDIQGKHAEVMKKDFEVLSSRVKYFRYVTVREDCLERRKGFEGQGVDAIDPVPTGNLQEAEGWVIGPFTDKLGVQANRGSGLQGLDEVMQLFRMGDQAGEMTMLHDEGQVFIRR